ncbi:MAG: ABC transporter permease [Pseudonocardiales bacterium]
MTRLIRAEVLKLRTTQVWFWLLLASVGVCILAAVASLASDDVHKPTDVALIFANANGGLVTAFIVGILGITTELRYQTFTPTVLITPSRFAIVAAKLITYALAGAAYAVVGIVIQLAIVLPWLASRNIDFELGADVRHALVGLVLAFVLFAIMGVGGGSLLRNQILAITLGLVFLLVIDNLIGAIPGVRAAFPYTPEGAMLSILYPSGGESHPDGVTLLSWPGGITVLLLWALVPAAMGAALTLSRDIT